MSTLLEAVRITLDRAIGCLEPDRAAALQGFRTRLDEPLRVAFAGRVKAGKSTLLNALVGEPLAATDAGECTRVVTWFRGGHRYQVMAKPRIGSSFELHFNNDAGGLQIELGSTRPEDLDRIDVTWPSQRLNDVTLVDTPGLSSLSKEVSDRSLQFLLPDGGAPSEADAVIYLMRWTHESDVRFLEPFAEDERAGRTPVNRVAVLSRADEIGSCKTDAMDVAARVAASWQRNPDLRRLCQSVVPVAGLVAQAGASLREDEYRALAALARLSAHERDAMLLSSDRFAALAVDTDISEHVRRELLRRLGLYGVRVAIQQISSGGAPTSSALAAALVSASGLDSLRCLLRDQFEFRAHVLKARSALLALDRILRLDNGSQARALLVETERIALGAHEIVEIGVLRGCVRASSAFPALARSRCTPSAVQT